MNDSYRGELPGRYFASGSSSSVSATLARRGELVLITLENTDPGKSPKFSAQISQISDRLASVARKITLSDGSVFETRDNDRIDAMFDLGGGFFSRMARIESSLKLVVIFAVVTIVLLVGLFRYGLPLLANGAAKITPTGVMTLMDKGTLSTVDRLFFAPSMLSDKRKLQVSDLFDEIAGNPG